MIRISTANGKLTYDTITEAEETYLGQVISLDGAENAARIKADAEVATR